MRILTPLEFLSIYKIAHPTNYLHRISVPTRSSFPSLESRVSVLKQLHKVVLEPGTRLGGRLERIGQTAVSVVAGGRGIRGTIALAAGLDPGPGVEERVVGDGGRADAEAGADDVAPVAPGLLLGGLDAVAAYITSNNDQPGS